MARLSTFVAVGLTGFSALHRNVTNFSTPTGDDSLVRATCKGFTKIIVQDSKHSPVTFHLVTKLLDVAKAAAGVALLLVGVAIPGHVT